MPFYPSSSLFFINNARNTKCMSVLIYKKCLDLRKILTILGQPPSVAFGNQQMNYAFRRKRLRLLKLQIGMMLLLRKEVIKLQEIPSIL